MKLKCVLLLVLVWAGLTASGHPLHLTFTNLEYQQLSGRWTVTIKVFNDDFASNLKMATGYEILPGSKSEKGIEGILLNWLESRFKIWFDSKPIEIKTWKYGGIKVKEDASWLTYTFTAPLPVDEIKIRNSLLLDLYSDQKNLFVLAMGKFQSAHEFKNKDLETAIKLNK